MRILWHSNAPWMKTGYGQQTAIWAQVLRALGHDVAIHGYAGAQHITLDWQGITVYPAGVEHAIGMDSLGYWYEQHQADLVISLCDAWALSPKLMSLMNAACWTPVDAEPLSQGLADFFTSSGVRPIAMSRYGHQLMTEGGLDAACIPHAIPCDLFTPPQDRDALRAEAGIGPETFVVGINQANRSGLRKALPEQLGAFARFHERHPDSRLILHMAKNHPKGQDLPLVLQKLGIGEGVAFFPDSGVYAGGVIGMEQMPQIYGAADVWMGCAMAGGFELPLAEAQACGVPVIATHGSAMTEVAGPHSWLVPGQDFWVEERHQGWWTMPLSGHACSACGHVDGIEGALESAWQLRENDEAAWEALRKQSREHALQYDVNAVAPLWADYLAGIEAALLWPGSARPSSRPRSPASCPSGTAAAAPASATASPSARPTGSSSAPL